MMSAEFQLNLSLADLSLADIMSNQRDTLDLTSASLV